MCGQGAERLGADPGGRPGGMTEGRPRPGGGLFSQLVGWIGGHRIAAVTVGLLGLAMGQVALLALRSGPLNSRWEYVGLEAALTGLGALSLAAALVPAFGQLLARTAQQPGAAAGAGRLVGLDGADPAAPGPGAGWLWTVLPPTMGAGGTAMAAGADGRLPARDGQEPSGVSAGEPAGRRCGLPGSHPTTGHFQLPALAGVVRGQPLLLRLAVLLRQHLWLPGASQRASP